MEVCHLFLRSNYFNSNNVTLLNCSKNGSITNRSNLNQLGYLLYTSGTTGNPKGVLMGMSGLTQRILTMIDKSSLGIDTRYLFKTNYVFDVSFSDIFSVLCSGGTLYVTTNIFDLDEIVRLIHKYQINTIHLVPSQLFILNDMINLSSLPSLQTVNVSGEGFDKSLIPKPEFIKRIINYYGPTETGEVSCEVITYPHQAINNKILIGNTFEGSAFYILNRSLNKVPRGAIGELYIGGIGVAIGYLNLHLLSESKFIKNPYQTRHEQLRDINGKLYKTGDLIRVLDNNELEYIGRNDTQVKVNGIRIELEAIEDCLMRYPDIKHAVVITKSGDITDNTESNVNINKYIIGYYVSNRKIDDNVLFEHLQVLLPEYMIPNFLFHLENLPLTPNGKLDIKLLPQVEFGLINEYQSPRTILEKNLCEIYADVLGLPIQQVGINHDFFKLGGNSILAMKLRHIIVSTTSLNITAFDIFQKKTVANLINTVHEHLIEFPDYYQLNNNSDAETAIIFVPGCEDGFERYYIRLAEEFISEHQYNIILLKSNFVKFTSIKLMANFYSEIITHIISAHKFRNMIICGFSAGGEISCFITKNLYRNFSPSNIKLVLFDSYLDKDLLYDRVTFRIRDFLNKTDHTCRWGYKLPRIKSEILYFHAKLCLRRYPIVSYSLRYRRFKQIISNLVEKYRDFKFHTSKYPNGLSYYRMNVYKVVELNAEHIGDNGILSSNFTKQIKEEILIFINRAI